ncbi:sugar ABC transporter permease [Candidatus Phytoplasma fraxini]|uniref:Carbohydrate ABC transport system, permease component (MalG) n=1 Tax=Ash yellows phytoplasma TaxID=35780 RepID=A0ABZ2U8H2_ASHYP
MFEIISQKKNKHWFYLTPALIVLSIFTFFPLIKVCVISMTCYKQFYDVFEGFTFENYVKVCRDEEFQCALRNTLLLVLFTVPISIFVALLIALALNNIKNYFFKNTFKFFFFFPLISNSIVMGMIFSILFYYNSGLLTNKPTGLFNSFINMFGVSSCDWTGRTAPYINKMFVLILYNIWVRLPFKIFIFILALENIDKSYYHAAKIDGASKWRIFTKITCPLIMPIFFYQFIIEMIAVFKEYDSVVGLFGDDPGFKMRTIVGYIYNQLSSSAHDFYSKGTVAAMILFVIFIFFTIMSVIIFRKQQIN